MNRTVRFLPEAVEDLIETQRWYVSREPALEQAFAEAIALAVERIVKDPPAFLRVYSSVRRLVVRRFPYALSLGEVGDEILSLAIHGRQDPRRWRGHS